MKSFFKKLKSWCTSHVWQSVVVGVLIVAVVATSIVLPITLSKKPQFADTVIYGNIITMDIDNPTAEAVAMKNGKILAVGTKDAVAKYINSSTIIDTRSDDEFVYPGFVDTHTHYAVMTNIMAGGLMINRENNDPNDPSKSYQMGDYEAYAKLMKQFIEENPTNEVYQGYGMWVMGNPPTASILDTECNTDKPVVFVGAGGHDCWINTAAIKQYVGNFEGTEAEKTAVDQWISQVGNDCVEFEENSGHKVPTGYFCETARFRITDQIPHDLGAIKETILGFQEMTLVKGYTTVGDCTIVENDLNQQVTAFKQLNNEGKLKLKFRSYYEIREYDSAETRASELQKAINLAKETKNNEHFQVVGIKIFLDGVYEALSAYTSSEYPPEAGKSEGYQGIQRWYKGAIEGTGLYYELQELVYEANKAGLAVEFHAMGDAAVKQALDACEYAAEKLNVTGTPNFRNAISHLGYIDPTTVDSNGFTQGLKDIERFAKLGVTAVVAPQWTSANESIYEQEKKCLGSVKVDQMYLIKSIIDTGANVAFHTDGAVMGGVPEMIFDAETRKDAANMNAVIKVRAPNEIINGNQCLECLTTNAAYAVKSEQNLGIIKVGMSADFSIYNKDFRIDYTGDIAEYNNTQLKALYINGTNYFVNN